MPASPCATEPEPARPGRLHALDLVRGIAVLGILTVNIAGFAGPAFAAYTPHALGPASPAGEAAHALVLVLFEGKMRALFSMLFGASLLLFVERAQAAGKDGEALQLRRLGWLAPLGYLHFLLWWGDILFLYALAGLAALALRHMRTGGLIGAALFALVAWQAMDLGDGLPPVRAELHALAGQASPAEMALLDQRARAVAQRNAEELRLYRRDMGEVVIARLARDPAFPLRMALTSLGETLPLMLIGMVLLRTGLFSGGWSRRQLAWLAAIGTGLGGAASAAFAVWAWQAHFPPETMQLAINRLLAFPHLLMALGYAALLMLAAPRLLATRSGRRLEAAGRMALSNYIATSLVMTGLFHGWGLGLFGTVPAEWQWAFVALGWGLMLAWSAPWLAHFRQGPLEWLWRSLTEGRWLPNRQRT